MELTVEQIESIEMKRMGDVFPKRLKHVVIKHSYQSIHGLIRINGEYYEWEIMYDK